MLLLITSAACLILAAVSGMAAICYAETTKGQVPVFGDKVENGTYPIEVESSSSMFRVVKASLTVEDGDMEAVLTLSGTGYLKLYMGTGDEANRSSEGSHIPYVEDAEGKYTYTIPVEALDQEIDCAAFSRRKQKWYDRKLVFCADSLPKGAVDRGRTLEDGCYTIGLSVQGGTGRATIASPSPLVVTDGAAAAVLAWDSPNYDYMVVNGSKYFPINKDGDSVFEIPVLAFDQEIPVIADTTAMSKPYEVSYTLIFHSDTIKRKYQRDTAAFVVLAAMALAVAAAAFFRKKMLSHV